MYAKRLRLYTLATKTISNVGGVTDKTEYTKINTAEQNKGKPNPPPTKEEVAWLKSVNKLDIELYEFAREIFND